jgi:hypothetical protein
MLVDGAPAVDPAYRHAPKLARAGSTIALGEAVLKWYDIAPADDPSPDEVRTLARRSLSDGARLGELRLGDGLGFVILHRCAEGFHFLLAQTWRNDNELWETVWAKDGEGDPGFHPWPIQGGHRPTFCVWELGAVAHERLAWSRYLRSARDDVARRAYLVDTFEGVV